MGIILWWKQKYEPNCSKPQINAIFLSDSEDVISKKVMGAFTDPSRIHKDDPGNPDNCMVYYYHK